MSAPSSSSASTGHATGAAGGEGSGLIDIRSMASAYLGGPGAAASKPASAGIGSIDDLPVFGGGGFSEPAVIVPTARPSGNNKILYAMIGAVGLLAVAAVVMVVMLLKSKDKPQQVAAATPAGDTAKATTPDDKGSAAATTPDKGSAATDTKTDSGSAAQVATNDKPPPSDEPKTTESKTEPKTAPKTTSHTTTTAAPSHTASPSHTESHASAAKADTAPAPKADTAAAGGCDEVSCVLNNYDGACCAKFKKKGGGGGGAAAAAPSGGSHSDLPDALDRSMISTGIGNVKARVTSCGDKSPAKGKVKVHVKVDGSGKVSNVTVETSPDAALGACVAAAVQKASFAKTQNGGSFSYPFVF
jgi:TonB family protein